jgi:hypothetical protein
MDDFDDDATVIKRVTAVDAAKEEKKAPAAAPPPKPKPVEKPKPADSSESEGASLDAATLLVGRQVVHGPQLDRVRPTAPD